MRLQHHLLSRLFAGTRAGYALANTLANKRRNSDRVSGAGGWFGISWNTTAALPRSLGRRANLYVDFLPLRDGEFHGTSRLATQWSPETTYKTDSVWL